MIGGGDTDPTGTVLRRDDQPVIPLEPGQLGRQQAPTVRSVVDGDQRNVDDVGTGARQQGVESAGRISRRDDSAAEQRAGVHSGLSVR